MISGHKDHFLQRCRERGYTLEEVAPCIVSQNGDTWTVDVDHPAYPRYKKTESSARHKLSRTYDNAIYVCDD